MNSPVRLPTKGLTELSAEEVQASTGIVQASVNRPVQSLHLRRASTSDRNQQPDISDVDESSVNPSPNQDAHFYDCDLKTHEHDLLDRLSAGELLRKTRDHFGLSVAEVSERLNLPTSYVRALEWDDKGVLPAGPFARGYCKNYADFLGLKTDFVLSLFDKASEDEKPKQPPVAPPEKLWWQDGHMQRLGIALLVTFVYLLAVVLWPSQTNTDVDQPSQVDQSDIKVSDRAKFPDESQSARSQPEKKMVSADVNQVAGEPVDHQTNDPVEVPKGLVHVDSVFGDQITVEALDDGRVIYHVSTEKLDTDRDFMENTLDGASDKALTTAKRPSDPSRGLY